MFKAIATAKPCQGKQLCWDGTLRETTLPLPIKKMQTCYVCFCHYKRNLFLFFDIQKKLNLLFQFFI